VQPKAARRYDGIEFRLTKRQSGNWGGALSYTYSRFAGNYSGLTATDVSDAVGRNSPNVDRAFDEPFMQVDAHGRYIDGLLPTDRPHTFKGYGYYRLKWWKFDSWLGAYQMWYSGTPLTSYTCVDDAPVFLEGRGKWVDVTRAAYGDWAVGKPYLRRTPTFSQTDLSLRHEIRVSKTNEAMKVGFEFNITNLFNQHTPTVYFQNMGASGSIYPTVPANIPPDSISQLDYKTAMTGYDYVAEANAEGATLSARYGLPLFFQVARSTRMAVRFTF
jgi:hypothetical protein